MNLEDVFDSLGNCSEEFTPIPFWFWNDELSESEILRQMKEMKDKGVDAFVVHPRKGLPESIQYLSDNYFHFVKYAVEKAREMNMKVVLYDEAMYPSGACHGLVAKCDESYASQGLLQIVKKDGDQVKYTYFQVPSGGTIRGVHPNEDDGEINAPKSADLLNPKAVAKFIELTHEKYYAELSEYFGNTVTAFFTDEPNILGRNSREDIIPWSDGIYEDFLNAGGEISDLKYLFEGEEFSDSSCDGKFIGENIEKNLQTFIDESQIRAKFARNLYKKVIHERLSESYYKQLSDWCLAHGIGLTGHPEKSTDIGYLKYFQMPCQDIVWRFVEPEDGHGIEGEHSTMGKCSSDSARHRHKRRNGNECFGCCGHRDDPKLFTENDMRWYLNWLFVRGVNLVYPHAFYYSVRGERGDERPPEVGLNNPFWPQYKKMSNYIKRMCYLNTDCANMAQVAILCSEDRLSWELAKPLITNQVEFNYLERELLTECEIVGNAPVLKIADQSYRVIVADKQEFDDLSDVQRKVISKFESAGGHVVITDENHQKYPDSVIGCIDREAVFGGEIYDLRFSHLAKEGQEYFILSNEGMKEISFSVQLFGYSIQKIYNPYTCEEVFFRENTMKLLPCELVVVFVSSLK